MPRVTQQNPGVWTRKTRHHPTHPLTLTPAPLINRCRPSLKPWCEKALFGCRDHRCKDEPGKRGCPFRTRSPGTQDSDCSYLIDQVGLAIDQELKFLPSSPTAAEGAQVAAMFQSSTVGAEGVAVRQVRGWAQVPQGQALPVSPSEHLIPLCREEQTLV